VKVTIEIPDQFIEDQRISAAESGIGYWANYIDETHVWEREDDSVRPQLGEAVGTKRRLDWKRAVRLAVERYPRILDPDNMDADTGDIWVQLAAFGEVKYG
jgi:hypothetical protein